MLTASKDALPSSLSPLPRACASPLYAQKPSGDQPAF